MDWLRVHLEELLLQGVGGSHPPLWSQLEKSMCKAYCCTRALAMEVEFLRLPGLELDLAVVGQVAHIRPFILPGRPPGLEDEAQLLQIAVPRKERLALRGQQLADHAPGSPQVHRERVVHRAEEHLRRLVPSGTDLPRQNACKLTAFLRAALRRLPGGVLLLRPRLRREPRRAKVRNLQHARRAVQEQVRGLQVPVHHAPQVEV
mmetsp:Transcript_55560/g.148839  ORF Transcript_55560/g.148839 Transcript_55560/m.148839 type:complete len:204 (+) Transcript_55560:309-920(+)